VGSGARTLNFRYSPQFIFIPEVLIDKLKDFKWKHFQPWSLQKLQVIFLTVSPSGKEGLMSLSAFSMARVKSMVLAPGCF
jgi:hypothetical protein